uniref:coiled-coil domain-containing protein 181-like n=1 Tax=Styela clava TaxID=7725 RepID=UPI00193A9343|nr:coiled-coil domain-containing protein 181-like [Styela clava]
MSENIDDDLEWLIEDDADVSESKPDTSEKELADPKPPAPQKPANDDNTHHTDTDTDDEDDGLTPVEREILERNTLLNDASDREEYDLKYKLEKANADLEKIDDSDSSREVKVMFKKKLVDVEAPPYDYSSASSSSSSDSEDETSKSVSVSKKKSSSSSSSSSSSEDEESKDKDMVVERGGKFQLISSSDKQTINSNPSSSTKFTPEKPATSYQSPRSFQEPKKRPNSAPVSQSRNMSNHQSTPRPGSASKSNEFSHLKSPYAMSPEMKELMKKRAAARAAREEEEKAQEKQKQEENQQNAEYAWKCWVEKKDEEMKERKRLEDEEKERKKVKYDSKKEADEAYALWLSEKRKQTKKDRLVEQQRQLEIDGGWYRRDRKECDKAYKRWLRQKSEETQKRRMQERKFGQQSRADAYRMRKLQRLIMSIQNSQRHQY